MKTVIQDSSLSNEGMSSLNIRYEHLSYKVYKMNLEPNFDTF